jgi:hypothetical protein
MNDYLVYIHYLSWVPLLLGAIISIYIISGVFDYIFPRKETYLESYPFQNTIRVLSNNQRILEFLNDILSENINVNKKCKSVLLNAFGMPPLILTNDIDNITYILKTNYQNFGKSGPFKSRFQGLLGYNTFFFFS